MIAFFRRYPLCDENVSKIIHATGCHTFWYGFVLGDWGVGVMVRRREPVPSPEPTRCPLPWCSLVGIDHAAGSCEPEPTREEPRE